jgi:hypothetical protein
LGWGNVDKYKGNCGILNIPEGPASRDFYGAL